MRAPRTIVATAALAGVAVAALAACQPTSTLRPSSAPVVLTGARAPGLLGTVPGRVVAFRHLEEGGAARWEQVPVQVDERAVVAFGSQPPSNATPGVTGTVYGHGSGGPTALQYTDASTWVGPDPDPTLDADDEIVFMASDAGGSASAGSGTPAGVVAGSGQRVEVRDPRRDGAVGWVYLFRSTGGLDPSAGEDYVRYDVVLASGAYKSTYRRADGPNPETSRVVTDAYEIGFSDRWKEDVWKVTAGAATEVDILDGAKNRFALSTCGRSNQTFADAEGAFVANVDGPVRAIRSYVGANSGPLTQRTHLLYRDREVVLTDLRVHAIPGIMDHLDLSAAALGMSYRSSTLPGGVQVDGVPDTVPSARPRWEAWNGPQGRVYSRVAFSSTQATLTTSQFQRDQASPPEDQCWGDGSFYGAAGPEVTGGIADTDPRTSPAARFRAVRTTQFLAPASDASKLAAYADDWARDIEAPLTATVAAYRP